MYKLILTPCLVLCLSACGDEGNRPSCAYKSHSVAMAACVVVAECDDGQTVELRSLLGGGSTACYDSGGTITGEVSSIQKGDALCSGSPKALQIAVDRFCYK